MRKIFLLSLFLISLFAKEKLIIAKFEDLQPYYYNNQLVHLKLKVISAVLGKLIVKERNNSYLLDENNSLLEIDFQLKDKFPTFNIKLVNGLDEINITPSTKIKQLYPSKEFCNVLANNLEISEPILTKYDKYNNIIYFNLKTDGNIFDFSLHLDNEKLYKVDKNKNFYTYSALVPLDKIDFKLKYFNLKEDNYKTIKFRVMIKNDDISTQTDIKPMAESKIYLINIILSILIVLLIILYLYKRKIIYLILILFSILSLIFFNLPKERKVLKAGEKLQLLPFKKSTTFLVLKKDREVKILNYQNGYFKVEFNNHIGWVKEKK